MIYQKLGELGIRYTQSEHIALYTIEELVQQGLDRIGEIPKNLFLRDASGKRHYLIVMQKDKQADLFSIRKAIGCSRLSFASEQRLEKHLGVKKGSVTPLAALFDDTDAVQIYLDRDLLSYPMLGVHPGTNTRTVWLQTNDLLRYMDAVGHRPTTLVL